MKPVGSIAFSARVLVFAFSIVLPAISARSQDLPKSHFSDPPTDREFLMAAILPQPLIPLGGTEIAEENRALGQALSRYETSRRDGAPPDALGPLTSFLQAYPDSRWEAGLYLNLGFLYRKTGHMSKALEAWREAWDLSKDASNPKARAVADYAVGELAEFEAYLGRMETLAPLLDQVKGRSMHGAGAQKVSNASQGLAEMHARPEDSFRCGPMALHRILLATGRMEKDSVLMGAQSTSRGTSLVQVMEWAKEVGLEYQMAYREPGAKLLVPAVMHWNVGHYAAIVKESEGLYQIEDPTFGENIWVSRTTLDEEGSGYFVVRAGPLPQGWRALSTVEGEGIWGRGLTSGQNPQGTSPLDVHSCPNCHPPSGGGMTEADVETMDVSLSLHDTPLEYAPAKGPAMRFELYYSQRDVQQGAIFTSSNFGPQWTSNWISIFTDNTSSSGTADLYMPGGGGLSYVYNSTNSTFAPGLVDQALVAKIVSNGNTVGFTRQMPDGSVMTYAQAAGLNTFFLSSVSDPQGNLITITYDTNMRITTLTDAAGAKTTLTYGLASDTLKVTQVTDPFGRSAFFAYNSSGQLASITDVLGIMSQYTYLSGGDFISTLQTPYGTSTFTFGDSTTNSNLGTERFVTLTDPLGQTQRVEYHDQAPGIAETDPPQVVPMGMNTTNNYLWWRDTFVWDAHQLKLATNPDGSLNYTMALNYAVPKSGCGT
jgi:YD repeat-containing protein